MLDGRGHGSDDELPSNWPVVSRSALKKVIAAGVDVASRKASQTAIEALLPWVPGHLSLGGPYPQHWTWHRLF